MSFAEFSRRTLFVVILVLVLAGAWLLIDQLLTVAVAVVLAVAMGMIVHWFQRKLHLKRGLAVVLAVIVTLGIVTSLGLIMVPPVVQELSSLIDELPGLVEDAVDGYEQLRLETTEVLSNVLPPLRNRLSGEFEISPDGVESVLGFLGTTVSAGLPLLYQGVTAVSGVAGMLLVIVAITLMLLIEPEAYVRASLYLVAEERRPRLLELWNTIYVTVVTWIRAQLAAVFVTTALVWIVLGAILGASHAVTVAVFAGLTSFVPNIGPFLPLIPILLFQLAADPTRLLVVVPAYLVIQLLESNVITPSIVKSELNIPAAAVLVFQLLAAIMFGAVGLVLAVPILAVGIVLVRELYSFDVLGLRDRPVAVGLDKSGRLVMVDPEELTGAAARQMNHKSMSSRVMQLVRNIGRWIKRRVTGRAAPPVEDETKE